MLTIYTDGSSLGNPGHGGAGVVVLYEDTTFNFGYYGGDNVTNNQMELLAVINALKIVDQLDYDGIITIKSDSQYVIKGITVWITNWIKQNFKNTKNKEYWQELLELTKNYQINWEWVKGHNNNKYNDLADSLAVRSANEKKDV